MASLLDMVQQHLGANEIDQISQQIGADPGQVQSAVSAALPLMVGGMASNASQPGGADAIHQSLTSSGGLLGNLGGMLGGGGVGGALGGMLGGTADGGGGGLLGKILGQHQAPVQQGVSKASGLDPDQAKKLLLILAPVVMGVLARKHAAAQSNPAQVSEDLKRESEAAQQQAQSRAPQLGGLLGQIFGHR
ncbi:MAG: DUF937 domain-containing protein [Gemmatimonadaceae bacterium]